MPCIRRRFNFGALYLAPHVLYDSTALCGQTVPVCTGRPYRSEAVYFAGWVNEQDLPPDAKRVKIMDIIAYTTGENIHSEFVQYCRSTLALGAIGELNGRRACWMVLRDNYPIVWCDVKMGDRQLSRSTPSILDQDCSD